MADASLGKCSIFVYLGGIAWTRHRWVCTGVKKCVEKFWNTGKVVGNPGKAVRCVCRAALKRMVMRIWREGTCSSKYKPENDTCRMRTVLAEWERYLQSFEIGWNASDLSYFFPFLFEIPPEHIIWEIVCAHVTLEISTMLSEHAAKLHISIKHLHELSPNRLCTYHLKKRVQVCGNNTSMA